MLYISTKFCDYFIYIICDIISNGFKVIEISILKITKVNNSAKNVGGENVVNLCASSDHALYLCQVS